MAAENLLRFLAASLVFFALGSAPAGQPQAQTTLRPDIEAFIDEMARKHRFEPAALRRVFGKVQRRPAVIRAMSAPATALPWHEFRARLITEERIAGGATFWAQNAQALARASREFGVPEEIIVATIGIETMYGRQVGTLKVLEALTTLAFDYPRRAEFFRGELEEFLLLARETGIDVAETRGSFAGAMGIPQFLPSSYRKYAVDFDGDGKPDLWGDPTDSIGSVANYYRAFGWQQGARIAVRAEVTGKDAEAALAAGIKPQFRISELKDRGIAPLAPVDGEAQTAVFSVAAEDGPQYWLGLQNFYVITRYNRSINYAMAVKELAREIRALVK